MLGVVRLQQGRIEEAVQLIMAGAGASARRGGRLCDGGSRCSSAHRFGEAVAHYDRALRLRPADPETLLHRAEAKLALGRHDEALADCDAALGIRPDFAEAWHRRGVVLLRSGAPRRRDRRVRARPQGQARFHRRAQRPRQCARCGDSYTRRSRATTARSRSIRIDRPTTIGQRAVGAGAISEAWRLRRGDRACPGQAVFHYNRGTRARAEHAGSRAERLRHDDRAAADACGGASTPRITRLRECAATTKPQRLCRGARSDPRLRWIGRRRARRDPVVRLVGLRQTRGATHPGGRPARPAGISAVRVRSLVDDPADQLTCASLYVRLSMPFRRCLRARARKHQLEATCRLPVGEFLRARRSRT